MGRGIGVLVAMSLCVVSSACAMKHGAQEGAARREERASTLARRPAPGPVESRFRPSTGVNAEHAFDPLPLPAPTEARLASGAPGPGYWQQRADYAIDVTLDAEARAIRAAARITYTNNSPAALDHVWLHLEQNAYRPDSLGAVAGNPDGGLGGVPAGFVGGMEIQSISVGGAPAPIHVYDTVARVDLPTEIAPRGGQTTLDVAWTFSIPENGSDRMGYEDVEQGAIFLLAQWFPAVVKYDDVNGWNTLPYMSVGEFYTDFGDYEVSITVPHGHVVGATGVLQNSHEVLTDAQRERLERARASRETVVILGKDEVGTPGSRPPGDQPLTWKFRAENVRTFAWASSPAFIWDAAAVDGDARREGGTLAMSLYPVEGSPLWEKSTEMLRFSIEHYNEKWFRYPYPVATNVNGHVPGMEYPMIIFCADRRDAYELYSVTTHEIGHNWFPMVVNTDERRHAWMDEGLNTFINYYAELAWLGERGRYYDFADWTRSFEGDALQPMATMPDRMWPHALGWLAYDKPAWMLITLRECVLGPERFDAAFRAYIRKWAFKSPQPADFFRMMENESGMDLAWFWRGWVYGTGTLDQGIEGVWIGRDGREARITLTSGGRDHGDGVVADMPMPVHLRLTFTDDSTADIRLPAEIWSRSSGWTTTVPLNGKTLAGVEIDPDRILPDLDRDNNVWKP